MVKIRRVRITGVTRCLHRPTRPNRPRPKLLPHLTSRCRHYPHLPTWGSPALPHPITTKDNNDVMMRLRWTSANPETLTPILRPRVPDLHTILPIWNDHRLFLCSLPPPIATITGTLHLPTPSHLQICQAWANRCPCLLRRHHHHLWALLSQCHLWRHNYRWPCRTTADRHSHQKQMDQAVAANLLAHRWTLFWTRYVHSPEHPISLV